MFWYKSWLETRWRFTIGAVILTLSAVGAVLFYPQVLKLIPLASTADASGMIGQRIREGVALSQSFRGYVWWQVYHQNLPQMGTVLAALLGTGGLLQQSCGSALFTLSLPVSRVENLAIRAAVGLGEWSLLAFAPSIAIVIFAPAIGQRYGIGDAFVQGLCLFAGGAVFYSLAFLLSTSYTDLWRPLLITCAVAATLSTVEGLGLDVGRYGIYRVMTAEGYFRAGHLPWFGLAIAATLSAAMLYAATLNMARKDF
jgi:hypothetical protein